MSKTDKHEFSNIWKWIRCFNDVMNHAGCVIKRDDYPHKMHSCSKNIGGISVFVLSLCHTHTPTPPPPTHTHTRAWALRSNGFYRSPNGINNIYDIPLLTTVRKIILKTMEVNKKMLGTNIFYFSHNAFYIYLADFNI